MTRSRFEARKQTAVQIERAARVHGRGSTRTATAAGFPPTRRPRPRAAPPSGSAGPCARAKSRICWRLASSSGPSGPVALRGDGGRPRDEDQQREDDHRQRTIGDLSRMARSPRRPDRPLPAERAHDLLVCHRRVGAALEDDLAAVDGVEPVGDRGSPSRGSTRRSGARSPISLICRAASMNRLTTTGASPSKGSSSKRIEGESVSARAMATIFFWPPERLSPRRLRNCRTSGKRSNTRWSTPRPRRRSSPVARRRPATGLISKFSATVRSGKMPASSGRVADAETGALVGRESRDVALPRNGSGRPASEGSPSCSRSSSSCRRRSARPGRRPRPRRREGRPPGGREPRPGTCEASARARRSTGLARPASRGRSRPSLHGPRGCRAASSRTCSFRRISSGVPEARIAPWCMATMRSE